MGNAEQGRWRRALVPDVRSLVRTTLTTAAVATVLGAVALLLNLWVLAGIKGSPEFRVAENVNRCLAQPEYLTSAQQCPLPGWAHHLGREVVRLVGSR